LGAGTSSALPVLAEQQGPAARKPVTKLQTFLLLFAVVLFNAIGNLSLAWGMRHVPEAMALNPLGYLRAMLNPNVALGIVLLVCWLLSRMTLLSWADLSFVLPLTGMGYILAAVFGKMFLGEDVTPTHWWGTFLICAGTAMVGSTEQQTMICKGAAHGVGS
jgi:drug/metabolite transporter (DMT)-like permease